MQCCRVCRKKCAASSLLFGEKKSRRWLWRIVRREETGAAARGRRCLIIRRRRNWQCLPVNSSPRAKITPLSLFLSQSLWQFFSLFRGKVYGKCISFYLLYKNFRCLFHSKNENRKNPHFYAMQTFSLPRRQRYAKREAARIFPLFPQIYAGLHTIHTDCPQMWAWALGRAKKSLFLLSGAVAKKWLFLSLSASLFYVRGPPSPMAKKQRQSVHFFIAFIFLPLFPGEMAPFSLSKEANFFSWGLLTPSFFFFPCGNIWWKKFHFLLLFLLFFSSTTFFFCSLGYEGKEKEKWKGFLASAEGHRGRRERVENLPSPSFPFFTPLWLIRKEKLHEGVRRNKNILFFVESRLCALFLGTWQDKQYEHFHPKTAMLLRSNRGSNSRPSSSSSTYVYFPRDQEDE